MMHSTCRRLGPALLGLALLAFIPTARAGGAGVTISDFAFDPPTLTVPAGTTVTWTNKDDEPHTVSSPDQRIDSPPLDTEDHYSLALTEPGTYAYFCRLHPHMVGQVVVTR
jgi:plastocyanin